MKIKKQIVILITIILFSLLYTTVVSAKTATVNTDTLKLRKEASTNSAVLELLNQDQKLEVIEEAGDFVKVKVNGITGFVHKDYINMEQEKVENTTNNVEVKNEIENTTIPETQNNIEENIINENTITQNENSQNQTTENQNNNTKTENNTQEQNFKIKEETIKSDTDVYILPLINASKMKNLKKDTKVIIMDEVKGWNYIQAEGISGWIRKSAFEATIATNSNPVESNNEPTNNIGQTTQTEEPNKETPIEEKAMYVNSSSVYVRKGPSTDNEVVDTLILNNQVIVTAEIDDWYKVNVNNKTGYIAKRLLSESKETATSRGAEERKDEQTEEVKTETTTTTSKGEEIVNYAKQYLGSKYVYGASGPTTFDCSGFTMYVYKHFGISLSHSARAQSKNGTYVAKENLQPGDLVFFKDYETMDGIGHCGIYIGERKLYSCIFWNRLLC